VRRDLVAIVHSGYWSLYLLLLGMMLALARGPHATARSGRALLVAWPVLLIALAPNAGAFYASYGPLFSRLLARQRYCSVFAGGIVVSLAAAGVGLLLAALLFGLRQPVFAKSSELLGLSLSLALVAAVHVAIALVIRGFVGWFGAAGRVVLPLAAGPHAVQRELDVIFVKTEQRFEKIRLDEILVIEGQRDYRRIHTPTRRLMTLQTFADFERQLTPHGICRVHKSYMVALDRIDTIERGRIAIAGLDVPISETYRESFFTRIGHR